MRAFLAIPLPDAVADALEDLQAELPVGRIVPRENLHLTLAFLGEEPEGVIESVHEALLQFRANVFDLELAGLGTLGGRAPAILHIAAARSGSLRDLHVRLRNRIHGTGLMLARERFAPHVTLARFRRNISSSDLARLGHFLALRADTRLAPFPVAHFSLFRSMLGSGPPVYEELARYPLEVSGASDAP
ncbi:RNA 2',3'-cyclic phosphodiesterase [Defluviimonas aquaemixtae]|uniref:RNA 2',3'-cyclic phosphodiesterase n=1 Tax=Albidovulum aquaemixtae TaxID=1542388 RepID=A0A2R8BM04_9RHOB|nr:RNA 2',3'-cyclic phosphodiesterase [Defluviimonas aquaemixtae]SPH24465.1 RNA 2',3'-cyclic phosphodiesterase [Defluviimonas aquaemixtae]